MKRFKLVISIIIIITVQSNALALAINGAEAPNNQTGSSLFNAGDTLVDPRFNTSIVRVTGEGECFEARVAESRYSSFNVDSHSFFVDIDGVPTLYSFDPDTLQTEKQGPLFDYGSLELSECLWSVNDTDIIFGLDHSQEAVRLYAYNVRTRSYTLLKDFSDELSGGVAQELSKSWVSDDRFAFSWRESELTPRRYAVVWDGSSDLTHLFDLTDQKAGAPGYQESYLSKRGKSLMVIGDVTREWRYQNQSQSNSIVVDSRSTGHLELSSLSEEGESDLRDLASLLNGNENPALPSVSLPRSNISRDGRFRLFSANSGGGKTAVYVSTLLANTAAPEAVNWTNLVNTTSEANSVRKTGGQEGIDDASATSQKSIPSGDAYMEFTVTDKKGERWAGLNNSNEIHQQAEDMDFAIKMINKKKYEIRENGVLKKKGKFNPGVTMRIAMEEGMVKYYIASSLVYTSAAEIQYPQVATASLLKSGSVIGNAMIAGAAINPSITINPTSATLKSGETANFTARMIGSQNTDIYWSATGGTISSSGVYTAPQSAGTYTVKATSAANSNISASASVTVLPAADTNPAPPGEASNVITDYNYYPEPSPPALPAAGGKFTDPTFGTTILRVTDSSDGAFNSTSYSYWPSFNKDNSRLFITAGGSPTLYNFDPSGFSISNKRPLFGSSLPTGGSPLSEDAIWSATDPNIIFCHAGLKLWGYNVNSNSYTLIKDFGNELPAGHLWQMSRSSDDKVFAFTRKDSNYNVAGYIVWRRDNGSIYRVDTTDLDEVQVDKTGKYLIVLTRQAGSASAIEAKVVNLQTGSVENLTDGAPDYAPGHKDMGSGFVIGGENWNNRFLYRRMDTPHQYHAVMEFGNDWSVGSHVSMLADDEEWMLISTFVANDLPSTKVFRNEIFQVATDGSKRVRRLAHTHSVYREYWDSPRATISRDGRFIVFTSNWGSSNRRDVFIVKVPSASGGGSTGGGTGSGGNGTPPPVSGGSTQNVVWTNAVKCSVNGSNLQKTSGFGDTPDAGARSQQAITSGDGYVEFTTAETNKTKYCGLANSVTGTRIEEIAFGIKLTDTGVAEVRERNGYKAETSYRSGDTFRIAVESGSVRYYKNGVLFYTSSSAPSYPLILDAVIIGLNGTINNAVMASLSGGSLAAAFGASRFGLQDSNVQNTIYAVNNEHLPAFEYRFSTCSLPENKPNSRISILS